MTGPCTAYSLSGESPAMSPEGVDTSSSGVDHPGTESHDLLPATTDDSVSVQSPQRSKTAPPPAPPPASASGSRSGSASTSASTSSATSPEHGHDQPGHGPKQPSSALRRTLSASSGSSSGSAGGGGGGASARERKRLRFTALPVEGQAGPSRDVERGLGVGHRDEVQEDVFYPGSGSAGGRGTRSRGVPRDQASYLTSEPGTPNFLETADQIRRTLSLASLDHLLALSAQSNKDKREKLIAEVSRAGRELVWRKEDEERLFPRDFERALVLALKRGLRSFLLAFHVRAGVNVLLMFFRTFRRRKLRLAMIRHAIFGSEPFRFGAMIGTFTFLNTLTLHLLRLTPPLSYFRRRLRYGLFNRPSFGPPEREGPEGERRWQAAVAGAVASLGLLWETRSRRRGVAQQMFVRGLQGTYNQYTPQMGIRIPHGDLLVFGACCGQIMYAWMMSPETMPLEYNTWILHASRVPEFALLSNRSAVNTRSVDTAFIQKAIEATSTTGVNREVLKQYLTSIRNGFSPPRAIPCELVHPWVTSCTEANVRRFFDVFRFMLPVYSALHLIPMLVLRRQHFTRDPLRMLARVIWGITRSCSFLGVFVMIFHSLMCIRYKAIDRRWVSDIFRQMIKHKRTFWLFGFSTCLSLLVEEKKRRAELAMYVLPRALESAWSSARKRAWVPIVPFGETILGAAAMAMVMDAYKHKPDALSGIVRRLMFQLVGPV